MHARLAGFVLLMFLVGCSGASYVTPGARADFDKLGLTPQAKAAMTDKGVQEALNKKPLLTFPAAIAVARVQAADYQSYASDGWRPSRSGRYSVVTTRDVETDDDFAALAKLPEIQGLAPLKRLLLTSDLNSDLELRTAAAQLHANLLLYYTFDTQFRTAETAGALTLISLGIAPNHEVHVISTISAVLMDTNNGYLYGVFEFTSKRQQLANAWTSNEAIEQIRRQAEREAFAGLIQEFQRAWPKVVKTYKR